MCVCDAQAIEAMGYLESRIPLVIFGHSFGAMLGVSIARTLERDHNHVPKLLVFAGCRPLHVRDNTWRSVCRLADTVYSEKSWAS